METKICCRYCKSEHIVKRGLSNTQNRGKQQRHLCKACKRTFIQDLGFWKMKNSEKIVTMSVDMYLSNLSSRKMRNQLKRHMETKVSHVSVLDWVRKYVLKVQKLTDMLTPKLSGKIYADETEVKRQRNLDVFWCAVDWDTRFINATLYSPKSQNVADATSFIKKIKHAVTPKFIQTDAGVFYPGAFRKVFNPRGRKNFVNIGTQHLVNNVSRTGKHNVRIETVFSKIKDRVKDFRGFKALWSAPILMAGIVLQHNFIEEHTTTRRLPCELANLKLDAGVNRWLGLIRLASL